MQIDNFVDMIKLPFRKEKELYSSLYSIIGFYPRNITYYKLALMHKSASRHVRNSQDVNNERLEFLGDAVLGAVVGDIVFRHFERKHEGFLTTTRSKLVQRDTLNKLSQDMGLDRLIKSDARVHTHNNNMAGNAFEALVGAIYLDRGFGACIRFINKTVLDHLINIDNVAYKEVNFKSKLLEWGQRNKVKVEFELISQIKVEKNSPQFHCKVLLEGIEGGNGKGFTKKESHQIASKQAWQRIRKEPQFIKQILEAKANNAKNEKAEKAESVSVNVKPSDAEQSLFGGAEFDLSGIKVVPKNISKEDIVTAAETAAFAE